MRHALSSPGKAGRSAACRLAIPLLWLAAAACCGAGERSREPSLAEFLSRMKDPRTFFLRVLPGDGHGAVIVGGNRLHPNQIAKMRFLSSRRSRAPLVSVSGIRTEPFTALVDPASTWSWMTLTAALRLDAVPLGPGIPWQFPDHLQRGSLRGAVCRVSTLLMDTLRVESALVLVSETPELGPLSRGNRPVPELVLGSILLSRFRSLAFDFPGRKLLAASTFPYQPDPGKLVGTASFRWKGSLPLIEARVNGIPRDLIFDPAGDFALLLPELREPATVKQLTLGDLVLRSVAAVPQVDPPVAGTRYGRIGRRCLEDFKVTLVSPPGRAYFERP